MWWLCKASLTLSLSPRFFWYASWFPHNQDRPEYSKCLVALSQRPTLVFFRPFVLWLCAETFCDMLDRSSGQLCPSLVVTCFFVSLPWTHVCPSGGLMLSNPCAQPSFMHFVTILPGQDNLLVEWDELNACWFQPHPDLSLKDNLHHGRDVIPSICFSMKWVDLNGNQRKGDCERPAGGFRQWLAAIHVPIFIDDRLVKDINARFRLSLDINVIQRVSENRPQERKVSFLEQPDHNVHSLPQYYRNLCRASRSGSENVVEILVWGRHPLCTHRWMTAVLLARFRPFCMWIFIQCCSWECPVLLFKTFLRESQMVELFRDPPYPQSKDPQSNFFPAFEASPTQKSGKDFCAELMHSTLAFWWYWIEFYFCSKIEASALQKVSGHLLLVIFQKKKNWI